METKPKKTIAPRVDMPCQPADVRAHNFDEVATGYTKEMAMQEASRCLQCKKAPSACRPPQKCPSATHR